jgi:hypothetical protein
MFDRWNKFRRAQRQAAREYSSDDLLKQIDELAQQNREQPDREREKELMALRHLAGITLLAESKKRPPLVEPTADAFTEEMVVPEVTKDELTPGLIRAAILQHGAILVRGLADAEGSAELAQEIDNSFAARSSLPPGEPDLENYWYDEYDPKPYHDMIVERHHIAMGGGVLAADAPRVAATTLDLFDDAGIKDTVAGYLGEHPVFSAHKTTLRKATPDVPGAWHQDGKFLGDVRALNLWLSLSHCGDTAPGMDLVPRRLENIVEAGDGEIGFQLIVVSQEKAEELAADYGGIKRPIFEPGDAMFFDHLYLHKTASEPDMPNPRYAVESWFFGPSAFPEGYIPLAY